MRSSALILIILPFAFSISFAEDSPPSEDEIQIAMVFEHLTDAWRDGDGDAWAESFVEDADFTVWFGLGLKSREQIAWGHQLIFDSFYADTVYEFGVRQIRFVRPDVAVVHLNASVIKDGESIPKEPDTVPMAILERIDANWKIIAFQDTPFVVNEFRANGDIKRFKKMAAEQAQQPPSAGTN